MNKFASLTISGLVSGAIFSLIACSLVLSYSASGIFNLAYGGVAFSTAFLYYELHDGLHWDVWPAVAVSVLVFAPLLGILLDRLVFRRLADKDDSAKIVAAVGLMVALPALMRWVVERLVFVGKFEIPLGNEVYTLPGLGPSPPKVWTLPTGGTFNSNQAVVFAAAAACGLGLWYLLRRTSTGLHMRAVVDRPALASLRGVDRDRLSTVIWTLGTMLAGLTGVIALPILNSLDQNAFVFVTFVAISACVFGRLRSIPLAFVGGLVLGVAQNLTAGYATFASSISGFNSSVPFVILLLGLALWNRDRSRTAGVASEELPALGPATDQPPWRRGAPWAIGAAVLFVYVAFLADSFALGLVANGLVLGVIFLSFVVVTGEGGMVSLAQSAFVTGAGLTTGLLLSHGAPLFVAALGGIVVATLLGVVVALPVMRLGRLPLALATLGLAFLGDRVLFAWQYLSNGQLGWKVVRPHIGPFDLAQPRTFAFAMAIVLGVVTVLVRNLQRSASGRAIVAVRSAEPGARMSGIAPSRTKLKVFMVSAAIAGLGGVLLAAYNGSVTGTTTPPITGLIWLSTIAIWGIRRPAGAIMGGLFAALFPQWLSGGVHWPSWVPSFLSWNGTTSIYLAPILFGLGAVQLASNPNGILSTAHLRRQARRAKEQSALVASGLAVVPVSGAREEELLHLGVVRNSTINGAEPLVDRPAPILTMQGVHAGYGDVEVLHGIDLTLRPGTTTVLLGSNGAGKSTLCAVMSGLVAPTAGHIRFDDQDVTALGAHERARLGLVLAPESRGVFPSLSVDENLKMRLRTAQEITGAYDRFPALGERRSVAAGHLSGGEQQMLALAPLLIQPPTVLIVDEPTLGLAPRIVGQVLDWIEEIRESGVAVLLVEEKARNVHAVADDVILFELGRVIWSGACDLVDADRLVDMYMASTGDRDPAR
ncbi:MAG: transporter related [Acidimicrobiales bacterium]|nr:transporter related [Acidimicrobiales bacterium]